MSSVIVNPRKIQKFFETLRWLSDLWKSTRTDRRMKVLRNRKGVDGTKECWTGEQVWYKNSFTLKLYLEPAYILLVWRHVVTKKQSFSHNGLRIMNLKLLYVLLCIIHYTDGTRGGAVGWGIALQAGRPWVRFPMISQSFRPHYGPGVDSASNRNEYQEYFLGR